MPFDPRVHHRRTVRLPGFDYARPGAYFVTVCTRDRVPLFGAVSDRVVRPSPLGEAVAEEWTRTAHLRPETRLDAFIVMPDHLHGIILITDPTGRGDPVGRPPLGRSPDRHHPIDRAAADRLVQEPGPTRPPGVASGTLGAIIGQFKGAATKRINIARGTPGAVVWQRGYYEHVIQNARSLDRLRRYIVEDPLRWALTRRWGRPAVSPNRFRTDPEVGRDSGATQRVAPTTGGGSTRWIAPYGVLTRW